jgi:EAL domain-containing protein (putative c-di-GMP-specific phosphodiesterase class I)
VRTGDTLARVDGDEFVILLEDLAPQPLSAAAQAKAFGLAVMHALSGSYTLAEGSIHVGCSVGATILAGDRQTTQDLIKQANIALHQAKKSGRNALRFFDPRMQESVNARAALEGELRHAIAAAQFELYYQLQVDESGCELGAEALLRWNHPQRGLIPPAQFIPLAEETHLILPIGQWVIDAACARLAAWRHDARARDLTLAINVSPLQFEQPEFAVHVLGAIRRHGIDARRLKLELTETMLQGDLERTVSTMNVLKAEGVQFALDDFGTGYSSLQYLKQLPLDQLKIDRSFVHDIAADPNDKAIVTTIIAIAGHLGLDVIAEGVETLEQREILRACGCNSYQGYLFGEPVPGENLFEAQQALTA